jgi:hypothetical protein
MFSGNSSGARGSRQSSSDRQSNNLIRGSIGGMLDQYNGNQGVPSPAPLNGQPTKLILANANSIIHSTPILDQNKFPIGLRSPRAHHRENGEDTNPLMRRNNIGNYSSDSE